MKRLISVLAALAVCLGLSCPAFAADPVFRDMPDTHWAYAAVAEAASDGVVSGYPDGTFLPGRPLTGAHFCAILSRTFFSEDYAVYSALPEYQSPWWSAAVAVCADADVLTGTALAHSSSQAEEPITRYDMAQVLANTLAKANPDAMPSEQEMAAARTNIEDWNEIPLAYHEAASICYAAGILQGMNDGTFGGESPVTRAQACTVYVRIKDLLCDSAPEPPAVSDGQPAALEEYRAEVLRLINAERAGAGLAELTLDEAANSAAQARAAELPLSFSHTRPDGRSCYTALQEAGASYRAALENIAAGPETPADVVADWMNSPEHRANILSADVTAMGIGFVVTPDGEGCCWVQMLIG